MQSFPMTRQQYNEPAVQDWIAEVCAELTKQALTFDWYGGPPFVLVPLHNPQTGSVHLVISPDV